MDPDYEDVPDDDDWDDWFNPFPMVIFAKKRKNYISVSKASFNRKI